MIFDDNLNLKYNVFSNYPVIIILSKIYYTKNKGIYLIRYNEKQIIILSWLFYLGYFDLIEYFSTEYSNLDYSIGILNNMVQSQLLSRVYNYDKHAYVYGIFTGNIVFYVI